jgi:hypothetical protein
LENQRSTLFLDLVLPTILETRILLNNVCTR